jgi:ammonia channel protein AmtB
LTVGLFSLDPIPLTTTSGKVGMLMGGGFEFFLVQCISSLSLTLLGLLGAYPIIWGVNKIIPLRLDPISEEIGCDIIDHQMDDEKSESGINKEVPKIDSFDLRQRNVGVNEGFEEF